VLIQVQVYNWYKTYNSGKIIFGQKMKNRQTKIHFTRAVRVRYCCRQSSVDFVPCLLSRIFMQFLDDGGVIFYSTTAEKFESAVADSTSTTSRCFFDDIGHYSSDRWGDTQRTCDAMSVRNFYLSFIDIIKLNLKAHLQSARCRQKNWKRYGTLKQCMTLYAGLYKYWLHNLYWCNEVA